MNENYDDSRNTSTRASIDIVERGNALMFNHLSLFSIDNLARISDWLQESGELYVDIHIPHQGGSGTAYFIRSLAELRMLIQQQQSPEISIAVFGHIQYPLRGRVDDEFISQALSTIPENTWYAIVSLDDYYPAPCTFLGRGNSHQALRQDLEECRDEHVGVGVDPFDSHDTMWFYTHADQVFVVTLTKNQNFYAPYRMNPDAYARLRNDWKKDE